MFFVPNTYDSIEGLIIWLHKLTRKSLEKIHIKVEFMHRVAFNTLIYVQNIFVNQGHNQNCVCCKTNWKLQQYHIKRTRFPMLLSLYNKNNKLVDKILIWKHFWWYWIGQFCSYCYWWVHLNRAHVFLESILCRDHFFYI